MVLNGHAYYFGVLMNRLSKNTQGDLQSDFLFLLIPLFQKLFNENTKLQILKIWRF